MCGGSGNETRLNRQRIFHKSYIFFLRCRLVNPLNLISDVAIGPARSTDMYMYNSIELWAMSVHVRTLADLYQSRC